MAPRRPAGSPTPRRATRSGPGPDPRAGCCTPPPGPLPLSALDAPSTGRALKALAEPARLAMLRRLAATEGAVCACDLGTGLGLGQPTVSHHLAVLKRAGLVTSRTQGRWAYYRLAPAALQALLLDLGRLQPVRGQAPVRRTTGRA